MKKLFFTLCALCLCGTMWGQDTKDSTYGLYYELDADNNATIVAVPEGETAYSNENLPSYEGVENGITIPAEVDGNPVVAIGASAFASATISGHLVIPASLLYLNTLSFGSCTGISAVTFEYSETDLTDNNSTTYASSFYGCSGITIVYQYRNISVPGSGAVASFSYVNKIETVYIGENVTEIAHYLYRSNNGSSDPGFSLKYVVSDAPTPPELGTSAFDNHNASTFEFYTKAEYLNAYRLDDTWLSTFSGDNMHAYDGDDPDWPEDENAFQDENGLWYDPIEDTDYECVLIADQGGDVYSGTITIPETVYNSNDGNTYTVTRIDTHAFANSSIEGHVIIPANILYMGESAFQNCTGLTEVTYEYSPTALTEENNTSQGGASFHGCTGLKTVNWYRDIVSPYTVNGCQQPGPFSDLGCVVRLNIGPRVTELLRYAFRNSSNATSMTTINCYAAVPPTVNTNAFGVLPSGCEVNVPSGSESAYAGSSWSTEYTSLTYSTLSNAYAVTISDAAVLDGSYYATYYNDNAVDIYPQGGTLSDGSVYDVTTYAATGVEVEDETAYLDLVEVGATVPAGVAVLVDASAAGTYTVIETTAAKSASYDGENDLYGFLAENNYYAVAPDTDNDYYFYKLTLDAADDANTLGFYWGASEGGAFLGEANKAYLVLPQTALTGLSAVKLKKGEGEDTTGITSVEVENKTNTVKGIYTIQGVRVSNMNQPGLYIVDGKKVLKR